jgi:hypothetical protein
MAKTPEQLRDEAAQTLRRARGWILAVGIMMFVFDQLFVNVVYGNYIPTSWKLKLLVADSVILCFFVAMYVLAKTKPLAACIAALCGFWALHLVLAAIEPASLFQGLILKILFTIALVRGIATAKRAQVLIDELAEVFE